MSKNFNSSNSSTPHEERSKMSEVKSARSISGLVDCCSIAIEEQTLK